MLYRRAVVAKAQRCLKVYRQSAREVHRKRIPTTRVRNLT